jgi:hypothetical protein
MLEDNSTHWQKNPHGVSLHAGPGKGRGPAFTSLQEAISAAVHPDIDAADDGFNKRAMQSVIQSLSPIYYGQPNQTDTSVGGNDAINCLWQFGEDDDIVHPITSQQPGQAERGQSTKGLGRVYNEMYQNNQQLLWMSFGVPKFTNMSDFYSNSVDPSTAALMNNGTVPTSQILGNLLGKGLRLAFQLPFLPIIGMFKVFKLAVDKPITKYYIFEPTMMLYYRMVNVIMSHLAVGMGLYSQGFTGLPDFKGPEFNATDRALPEVLKNGPDIFTIIDKRSRLVGGEGRIRTTDDLIRAVRDQTSSSKTGPAGWLDKFNRIVSPHALGGSDYVGFRIEKGSDATESISNSISAPAIVGKLNAKASSAASKKFDLSGLNTGVTIIDASVDTAAAAARALTGGIGGAGVVEVMSGNGFFDIPDVWKSSSFSKSHSFTIQLRSKYGDRVSIYQSIYIPLAMLLTAALPRGVGGNTYTSPFILEAYAKGQFAIPLGMIESMTIKRGLSEFGWTHQQLPTAVDVTLNIKDLSPAFFLSVASGSRDMLNAFAGNSSMHEYLTTLSGIGLADRTFLAPKLKRRLAATVLIQKNTTFSPLFYEIGAGHSGMQRMITNAFPAWSTPNN